MVLTHGRGGDRVLPSHLVRIASIMPLTKKQKINRRWKAKRRKIRKLKRGL
jgi:hypothetical protein